MYHLAIPRFANAQVAFEYQRTKGPSGQRRHVYVMNAECSGLFPNKQPASAWQFDYLVFLRASLLSYKHIPQV
jgi:hypothetical protein